MNCEWREKIGVYVDGEMEPAAEQAFAGHLQSCAECSAAVVEQQEIKKAVRVAGKRFTPPPDLYASVRRQIHAQEPTRPWRRWMAVAVSAVLLAAFTFVWFFRPASGATAAQLIDQHITMMASVNPFDVISEDRHTVKPWFQGKLPFTFNLPELNPQSDFKLLGGKLVYAQHSPGAEVVYQVRQHKISVFIFQDDNVKGNSWENSQAFTVRGWRQGGLRYCIVTDAAREDADRLRALLEEANRS